MGAVAILPYNLGHPIEPKFICMEELSMQDYTDPAAVPPLSKSTLNTSAESALHCPS